MVWRQGAAVLGLSLLLAACGAPGANPSARSTGPAPATSQPATASAHPALPASASAAAANPSGRPSAPAAAATSASVFFTSQGKLVAESEPVSGSDPLRSALQALMKGPSSAGHYSEIPPGTKLLNVSKQGDTAEVSLSDQFFGGSGSSGLELRLGQVVYTATSLPNVQRVQLLDEGKPASVLGGEGINVSQPLSRESLHGVTAAS